MRRVLQLLLAASAGTGFAIGAGLLLTVGESHPPVVQVAPPAVTSTPLSSYDTTGVAVRRAAFCEALPDARVAEALGAEPDDSSAYVNGQRSQITKRVTDVAHEFDCSFSAGRGESQVVAQAWVFAPPVTPDLAAQLARMQLGSRYCAPLSGAPDFGSPSAATYCHTNHGLQVSYRGLFGDAWLACSVTGGHNRDALRERAGRWCVAVAQAASTPGG